MYIDFVLTMTVGQKYCRASHTGDAPRVAVVAQNVARLLCLLLLLLFMLLSSSSSCYPCNFFLGLVVVQNRQTGGVFMFLLRLWEQKTL